MPRCAVLLPALLLLFLLGGSAATGVASAAPIEEKLSIKTSLPGVTLEADVQRPEGPGKVPILLTYTPYASLADPDPAGDGVASEFVPKGYARVVADTPGTHGSTGCWDYGGPIEQQAGVDLVEQLSKLPWSNGKVALLGVSYEGTTANMLAARGNIPGLAAIVPESAISRWYGYAYFDGVRYAGNTESPSDEGADTPLGFDLGFGRTLSPDPTQPQFGQAATDRAMPCDSVEHTQKGYSRDPDYDAFWLERDYLKDAAKFRVPVLIAHGWQDENVRQSEGLDLFEKLPVDDPGTAAVEGVPFKRLYMFQGTHQAPVGEQWPTLLEAFFEHTLKGVANGVENGPEAISFTTDGDVDADTGDVFPTWPPPRTGDVALQLGRSDGAGTLGPKGSGEGDSLIDLANTAEDVIAEDPTVEATWLTYASAPLSADIRIAGSPRVDAVAAISGSRAQLAPVLLDAAPGGAIKVITRGFLDVRYREGLDHRAEIPQGPDTEATVRMAPQDQIVRKGHQLVLALAGSNQPWAVPEAPGTGFAFRLGERGTTLRLPIVGAGAEPPAPAMKVLPTTGVSPGLVPSRRALTVSLRRLARRGGRVRVQITGRAPRGVRVTVKVRRGTRLVASRRVRASRRGTYRVVLALRGRGSGRITATATARVRGRTLTARTR